MICRRTGPLPTWSSSTGTGGTASTAGSARQWPRFGSSRSKLYDTNRSDYTMIARHEVHTEHADLWGRLAAPLSPTLISWRQDGRPVSRDGKFFARFVSYVEANTVRERLDEVVPGEWNLTLELMP